MELYISFRITVHVESIWVVGPVFEIMVGAKMSDAIFLEKNYPFERQVFNSQGD